SRRPRPRTPRDRISSRAAGRATRTSRRSPGCRRRFRSPSARTAASPPGSAARRPRMGGAPLVVVANPAAGNGKAGKVIGKLEHLLPEAGIPHEIALSTAGSDLEQRVRTAAPDGAVRVGCLGGDGTVGIAANGLAGTDTTLAVFPSGTADDFAHAIGLRNLET